jgi:hypothetical protein
MVLMEMLASFFRVVPRSLHTIECIVVVGQTGDELGAGCAHRARRNTLTDEDRAALVDDLVLLTLGRGGGHPPHLVDARPMVLDVGDV